MEATTSSHAGSGDAGRWGEWDAWTSRDHRPAETKAPLSEATAPMRRRKYAIRTPVEGSGGLRKFTLVQTTRWFYLVGSTASGDRARILRVDREQDDRGENLDGLSVELDPLEYQQFLAGRSGGHSSLASARAYIEERVVAGQKAGSFKESQISGLLGAVRFTEGFYLVLAKGAEHVADLGCHEMHRVEEMELVQVSTKVAAWTMRAGPESRYKERFHSAQIEK
jgi:hypothetical protein